MILEKRVVGLNAKALERFVLRARKAVGLKGQVNVLVTSSAAVRALNQRFRSENKTTDVLSFPATDSTPESRSQAKLAGEIAICADTALRNAFRLEHSAAQEIKILALHGILHLAGFDHERDNGEMARTEARLRRTLRLPAGLIERVHHEPRRPARSQPTRFQSTRFQPTTRPSSKLRRRPARAQGARNTA